MYLSLHIMQPRTVTSPCKCRVYVEESIHSYVSVYIEVIGYIYECMYIPLANYPMLGKQVQ